jgi:hypothetical protein
MSQQTDSSFQMKSEIDGWTPCMVVVFASKFNLFIQNQYKYYLLLLVNTALHSSKYNEVNTFFIHMAPCLGEPMPFHKLCPKNRSFSGFSNYLIPSVDEFMVLTMLFYLRNTPAARHASTSCSCNNLWWSWCSASLHNRFPHWIPGNLGKFPPTLACSLNLLSAVAFSNGAPWVSGSWSPHQRDLLACPTLFSRMVIHSCLPLWSVINQINVRKS